MVPERPMHVVPLVIRPLTRDEAVAFVAAEHRHNKRRLPGWKFGAGLLALGELRGVGIAGRCSSRVLDQRGGGHWIECTRVCTDGIFNGCSKLYGALLRAAKALGYCRAYTYTLDEESGASLRASGWIIDARLPARAGWSCASRPRDEDAWPEGAKIRWVRFLGACKDHPSEPCQDCQRDVDPDTATYLEPRADGPFCIQCGEAYPTEEEVFGHAEPVG